MENTRHQHRDACVAGECEREGDAVVGEGKLDLAKKCIIFWEEHVKDTNAIFFRRKYEEYYDEYN